MVFQNSWWNISISSLVIRTAVFFRYLADKQTDKCRLRPYPATAVCVGNLHGYPKKT